VSLALGERVPDAELPDTDGRPWSTAPEPGDAATVVLFTCNHCPYALAWQGRLADAARDYAGQGVRFLAVNSNDAERYPRDSLEQMRERVAREHWPMPYLHDSMQAVARAFGAKTTPDLFVFDADGILRYRGAPDADHDDESLAARWLRDALDAVIDGRDPELPETRPVGCSIKWKPSLSGR
jgi:peroxiredoxin